MLDPQPAGGPVRTLPADALIKLELRGRLRELVPDGREKPGTDPNGTYLSGWLGRQRCQCFENIDENGWRGGSKMVLQTPPSTTANRQP
jgi:hypothetical protein